MPREQARRVGAHAEEGRLPERQDPRVAEDEIERQREQPVDEDLTQEQPPIGHHEEGHERRDPERDLERMPARAPDAAGAVVGGG